MISSETPYKLAEIIRDTWPNLFWLNKINNQETKDDLTIGKDTGDTLHT